MTTIFGTLHAPNLGKSVLDESHEATFRWLCAIAAQNHCPALGEVVNEEDVLKRRFSVTEVGLKRLNHLPHPEF